MNQQLIIRAHNARRGLEARGGMAPLVDELLESISNYEADPVTFEGQLIGDVEHVEAFLSLT